MDQAESEEDPSLPLLPKEKETAEFGCDFAQVACGIVTVIVWIVVGFIVGWVASIGVVLGLPKFMAQADASQGYTGLAAVAYSTIVAPVFAAISGLAALYCAVNRISFGRTVVICSLTNILLAVVVGLVFIVAAAVAANNSSSAGTGTAGGVIVPKN